MRASRRFAIRHETVYEYQGDVAHAHQLLHLSPRACPQQVTWRHELRLDPAPASREDSLDAFGNFISRLEFDRPHRRLAVVAESEVEVHARPDLDAGATAPWEHVRESLSYRPQPAEPERLFACAFRLESPYVRVKDAFADYARDCFGPARPILAAAEALMVKLHREFAYSPGETTIATPLLDVLARRRGVCQDFAHVMIACLRALGLAARYVSGYLKTTRADASQARGTDASHAWVGVYCPPFGWIDLDPTNALHVAAGHVTLAWGRDFADVSPLRGVLLGGGSHSLEVRVAVAPLD